MSTATATRNVGDLVSIDDPRYPGNWKITGFGPKNVILEPVGGGRGLRCPAFMLKDKVETTETTVNGHQVIGIPFVPVQRPDGLMMGAVVTVKHQAMKGAPAGALYVVLADKFDSVNIAVLGGNPQRPDGYWRNVPVSRIDKVVDVSALKG